MTYISKRKFSANSRVNGVQLGEEEWQHPYAAPFIGYQPFERVTYFRIIQKLMYHNSLKTTLSYIHISVNNQGNVHSPLDINYSHKKRNFKVNLTTSTYCENRAPVL